MFSTIVTAGFTSPSDAQSAPNATTNRPAPTYTSPALPGYRDIGFQTIPDAFNNAFFRRSGDFFKNDRTDNQFKTNLGIGGYPERRIMRDTQTVGILYRDFLEQQVSSDPIIRTPDLENPFSSSLLTTTIYVQPPPPAYNPPPAPPPVEQPPAPPVEPPPAPPRALY
jgi:hypothetical protein